MILGPNAIVPSELCKFGKSVQDSLRAAGLRTTLLYEIRISSLLKPKRLLASQAGRVDRNTIYQGVVDVVAVVDGLFPIAVFDRAENWSEKKAAILACVETPYNRIGQDNLEQLISEIGTRTKVGVQNRVARVWPRLNSSKTERLAFDELTRLLGDELTVLPEVALNRALVFEEEGVQWIRAKRRELVKEYSYLKGSEQVSESPEATLNFDFTVATIAPVALPILFLEYDGFSHPVGEPNEESVGTHIKDKIKNETVRRARVPLIRVRSDDQALAIQATKRIGALVPKLAQLQKQTETYAEAIANAWAHKIDCVTDGHVRDDLLAIKARMEERGQLRTESLVATLRDAKEQNVELSAALEQVSQSCDDSDLRESWWISEDEYQFSQWYMGIANAIDTNPHSLYSIDSSISDDADGYAIRIFVTETQELGLKLDERFKEVIVRIPMTIFAVREIKQFLEDELKRQVRDEVARFFGEQVGEWFRTNKIELRRRLSAIAREFYEKQDQEQRERISNAWKERLRKQTTPDDILREAERILKLEDAIYGAPGIFRVSRMEATQEVLARHEKKIEQKLIHLLTILNEVLADDADARKISEEHLRSVAQASLQDPKFRESALTRLLAGKH